MKILRMTTFVLMSSAIGCASSSSTPDPTAKFAGKWTYQPGSTITVECPGAPPSMMDLAKVPPSNQPGYFVLSSGRPAGSV